MTKPKFTNKQIAYGTIIILIIAIYLVYRLVVGMIAGVTPISTVNVYENTELKNQNDFKLIGQKLYQGGGYEPGFNFTISLAGTKFGVDLTSQYGDTRYVGYLDLTGQSTSTKIFSGNMLDKNNQAVSGEFKILTKECNMANGSTTPYTVNISVSTETLTGCAEILN